MPPLEFQLLVQAVRTAPPDPSQSLPPGVDWPKLVELAVYHGVEALLHQHLARQPAGTVPPEIQSALKATCLAQNRTSLHLSSVLVQVMTELQRQELPVLAYKGPTLALQAYGGLTRRPFGDLDLLIHPRDLDRTRTALRGMGHEEYPRLTPAQLRSFYRSECECWYAGADGHSAIELHWAVRERLYSFPLDLDRVFARRREVELCGAALACPAPEDLLLILSVHGAKHAWRRLKWVVDVDRLLAAEPHLNWPQLLLDANRLRARRLLLLCLAVAAEVLGTELPEAVTAALHGEPTVVPLARQAAASLWSAAGKVTEASLYLRAREDLRDRAQFCLGTLFTPTLAEWEAWPLPDALFPLYYLYRPLRLLRSLGVRR